MASVGNTLLADTETAAISLGNVFPNYPVPSAHALQNLATNIGGFVVPANGVITFEVLANDVPVPGYTITYLAGETGVKSILFGPVTLPINGTFGLRVSPSGLSVPVEVSAAIEID